MSSIIHRKEAAAAAAAAAGAGAGAVHALVEAPCLVERHPQQTHVLEHDVGRADGARENGGVAAKVLQKYIDGVAAGGGGPGRERDDHSEHYAHAVEGKAALAQKRCGMVSLRDAFLGEITVHPSREPVLQRAFK